MFYRTEKKIDPLDKTLLHLSKNDTVTARDMMASIGIFGRSGSGKTTGSGMAILRAVVSTLRSGGLLLAAKPADRAMVVQVFRDARRENDLLIFEAGGDLRFNFIDYEMRHGGHTRNIVRCIMTIAESLQGGENRGGSDDGKFFEQQSERLFFSAIEVLKLSRGRVSAPEIQQFITTAAYSSEQISNPAWQAGFHNQCVKMAFDREKTAIEQHDFELACNYWLVEFPQMAEKTRSSILAHVLGVLHVFNTGLVRQLVSGETNVSPDEILGGKWLLVDLAPAEYGDIGTFISCGWKYLCQRRILRRAAIPNDPPIVIWCDEAQQFVNSFDAQYLAQCRSHLGCMVYLTQSLHSYYAAMPGQTGKHQADALLSNFGHKIFHALGDTQTAEYASGLIGKSLQTFVGGSMAPLGSPYDELMGRTQMSTSTSEHFEHVLQPNRFINGLRTGGPANNRMCDAIVVRSGQPFASGDNWIQVAFRQC